jgi:NADPH2:quinone reductase
MEVSMKAVRLLRVGSAADALAVEELPIPVPKPGEVLIKLAAAAVNFADIGRRTGIYPVTEFPSMLGIEGAGTVAALGAGVSTFEVDDRVMATGCLIAMPSTPSRQPRQHSVYLKP